MIALLIILTVLLLILLLPVGVKTRYDENGTYAAVQIGPYFWQLIPKKKGKKQKKEKQPKEKSTKATREKTAQPGGNILDFWPFVEMVWSFLKAFRRKLLIKELTLQVCLGGDDAAQTAINYGRAQAVLAAVYPRLRQAFRIRKERVGVNCDFHSTKITVVLGLHIRLRIVDLLHLGGVYGFRVLRTYLDINKKRKALCQQADSNTTIKNKAVQ